MTKHPPTTWEGLSLRLGFYCHLCRTIFEIAPTFMRDGLQFTGGYRLQMIGTGCEACRALDQTAFVCDALNLWGVPPKYMPKIVAQKYGLISKKTKKLPR